jgi:hypothetical protein
MYPAHPVTAMISWKAARTGAEKFASAASARAKTHVGIPAHGSRVLPGVSDGALEGAASESVCMAPFSAPFSGFCPQLRSLCKGRDGGWCSSVSGRRPFPFCHPPSRTMAMADGRFCLPGGLIPADDADASARPAPLCAAQARPARRSGHEAEGSVRRPPLPPCRRRETIFRRPLGDGLRPSLAKSADPASPRRLAVYPWRDGGL